MIFISNMAVMELAAWALFCYPAVSFIHLLSSLLQRVAGCAQAGFDALASSARGLLAALGEVLGILLGDFMCFHDHDIAAMFGQISCG